MDAMSRRFLLLWGGLALIGGAVASSTLAALDAPDWLIYVGALSIIGTCTFVLIYTAAADTTGRRVDTQSRTPSTAETAPASTESVARLVEVASAMRESHAGTRDLLAELDDAVTRAMAGLPSSIDVGPQSPPAAAGETGSPPFDAGAITLRQLHIAALTPSEREIALLLAEGRTVPEIAESLFLSQRLVETQVQRLHSKLRAAVSASDDPSSVAGSS